MIIDCHVHSFPDRIAKKAIDGMVAKLGGRLFPSGDGTLGNLLDAMTAAGIDKAVMCPIATKPEQADVILRTALETRDGARGERAARMIVPFASVHPEDPDFAQHLQAVADAGIRGIKLHPYYQGFRLDDPRYSGFFAAVRDAGLVVQCHCGLDLGFAASGCCGPANIVALLEHVKGLKFIAAHLGGWSAHGEGEADRLLETDCLVDTAVLVQDQPKAEPRRIMAKWPADRILFGTDYPWNEYPKIIAWVRSLRSSDDDLKKILHLNAERLLGL